MKFQEEIVKKFREIPNMQSQLGRRWNQTLNEKEEQKKIKDMERSGVKNSKEKRALSRAAIVNYNLQPQLERKRDEKIPIKFDCWKATREQAKTKGTNIHIHCTQKDHNAHDSLAHFSCFSSHHFHFKLTYLLTKKNNIPFFFFINLKIYLLKTKIFINTTKYHSPKY